MPSKKWGSFFISGDNGVFTLRASNSGIDKNKLCLNDTRKTPYITRSDLNNGISLFVGSEQKQKYKKDSGNVITVGLDTQTAFYQPHEFFTGQNIQVLGSEKLNKYNALFLATALKSQLKKFNWGGNGATLGRLKRTKILLPVTDASTPDYDYMAQYIKISCAKNILLIYNIWTIFKIPPPPPVSPTKFSILRGPILGDFFIACRAQYVIIKTKKQKDKQCQFPRCADITLFQMQSKCTITKMAMFM